MQTIQELHQIAIDPTVRSGRPYVIGTTVTVADVVMAKLYHGQDMELYQEVYLLSDLPAKQLHRGDVAMLVELVPHPSDGEQGAVLEIFNALGESVNVMTVPISLIAPLRADQVPAVRPMLAVA